MNVLDYEFEKWWKAVYNDEHLPIGAEDYYAARLAWNAAIRSATHLLHSGGSAACHCGDCTGRCKAVWEVCAVCRGASGEHVCINEK